MKLILGYIIIDIGKTWLVFVHAISVFVIMKMIVFNNNNNGNFICVFECTIVNLATFRQFTNAAWDWIIKKKKTKNKNKTKTKTKQNKSQKKKKFNIAKSGLSQFLFVQQKM